MFRCTECNCEYKEKPNFCDCGNDIFEEIIVEENVKKERVKKTFEEQYPMLARFKESLDPISVSIFIVCIILSILSLIFIGNSDNEAKIVEEIKEVVQTKVKDIDEIWDDTPVKVTIVQEKKSGENKVQEPIKVIKVEPSKKAEQKKAITPKKEPQKVVNNVPKTTVQTTQKNANQTNNVTQKETKTTQLKPTITPSQTETKTIVVPQNQASIQELKIYKNSLRNLLFSKIDFTQIQGDGIGIVSFKLDSNGKLISKAFVQRSNNDQLDDAIFYSLNTTSSYKAPPSSYNGETLKFRVKFVGGQWEVSLN